MSASVDNQTALPTGAVEAVVHWTLGNMSINVSEIAVRIVPTLARMHTGRFYGNARTRNPRVWRRSGYFPAEAQHLIFGSIPYVPSGDNYRNTKGGPPRHAPSHWMECLVCITAHEGHHAREFMFPDGEHRFSEVDAEWTEYNFLTLWRERRYP